MSNKNKITLHVISYKTLVLKPHYSENRLFTLVYEGNQVFTVPWKPLHSIYRSCRHYGTSYKSARNNALTFLHYRQKLPIVVAYDNGLPLVAIPMMSPEVDGNTWIMLHAIINFEKTKYGCLIHLKYNQSIEVEVSAATVQRQIALATILHNECINRFQRINGAPFHDLY